MNEAELLALLKSIAILMNKAFNYDGDVFGKLHNDAVDTACQIESLIKQIGSKCGTIS
jgi:hypothetical protein